MNKLVSTISGVIMGLIALGITIVVNPHEVSHADLGIWDSIVASGDLFDWNSVFHGGQVDDIYALVHDKVVQKPQREALEEVAKSYGLTTNEAQRVVNGSRTPIFNNPDERNAEITQEQAFLIAQNIQDDYEHLKELYQLQQELDLATTPSEMFANGDLSDSGFDLVHDLNVIEEILFMEVVPNTLGVPYNNQLNSPFLPTDSDQTLKDFVASENDVATINLFSDNEVKFKSGVSGGSLLPGKAKLRLNGGEVDVDVLLNDICPTPLKGPLEAALGKYVEKHASSAAANTPAGSENKAEAAGDGQASEGASAGEASGSSENTSETDLVAAVPGKWLSSWCPYLEGESSDPNNFLGDSGFSSLGSTSTFVLGQAAKAIKDKPALKKNFSLCLDIELVKQRVSSYLPSDNCILCEIEKINQSLDKTLSHSLVPNKVTGNLLESAKCKQAYQPLLDMKFITIKAPVATPPNDDLIFGRNVFDEWNKFVQRYQPLLLPKADRVVKTSSNNLPADTTQLDILNQLGDSLAKESGKALLEIETIQLSNDALNDKLYAQTMINEFKTMTLFFESYFTLFEDTAGICKQLGKKPDIQ